MFRFVAVALLVFVGFPAAAEKRVALVMGNSAYEVADKLVNPTIDSRAMRTTLEGLGFTVVYGENLAKQDMERAIGRFAASVGDADVAIAYYAGHGATFGGVPYMVPVNAQFRDLEGMPYELVPLEVMVSELRRAKGIRVAIVDACRDNTKEQALKSVAARGGEASRGLGRVAAPDGLILAYATAYNSTAADGAAGSNSPFTAALLRNLPTPGLDIKEVFFRTSAQVLRETNRQQRPEIAVSLYDDFTLVPGSGGAAPPSIPQTVIPIAPPPVSAPRAPVTPAPVAPPPVAAVPPVRVPTMPPPAPSPPPKAAGNCDQLWYARNSLYARAGYCFKTQRGIAAFGTNCRPPYGELAGADKARVQQIQAQERSLGCAQ